MSKNFSKLFGSFTVGGDTIQRKILFSMLLLLGLALFLNMAAGSAAVINQTTIKSNANSMADIAIISVAANTSSKKMTKIKQRVSQNINSTKFKAAGAPVLVNGLTLAQMKDGISRAQAFYTKNGRLPHYVSFGNTQIPIATFEQNIATQGLTINTSPKSVTIDTSSIPALAKSLTAGSTSTYNSAVSIFNWVRDNIGYSFYYNTKYGAAGTLISRTGNCCDTSNLLVALARAAGIPARYKSGYCQFSSGTWYGHVWTDLYVNGKWYPADAISYRNTFGTINNWNTSNFQLRGTYNTLPF